MKTVNRRKPFRDKRAETLAREFRQGLSATEKNLIEMFRCSSPQCQDALLVLARQTDGTAFGIDQE